MNANRSEQGCSGRKFDADFECGTVIAAKRAGEKWFENPDAEEAAMNLHGCGGELTITPASSKASCAICKRVCEVSFVVEKPNAGELMSGHLKPTGRTIHRFKQPGNQSGL